MFNECHHCCLGRRGGASYLFESDINEREHPSYGLIVFKVVGLYRSVVVSGEDLIECDGPLLDQNTTIVVSVVVLLVVVVSSGQQ